MNILLTNDDGFQAKGLDTLIDIMCHFGMITVVAPKFHQSGMSTAVSLGLRPVAFKDFGESEGVRRTYLDATPASCVKFAINYLFEDRLPDLLVSGINHGSNASTAACYSGTLGAAEEAALNGIPAVGVSLNSMSADADFTAVRHFLPKLIEKISARKNRFGMYYNINFPAVSDISEIKGVRVCEMGLGKWVREFQDWDPEVLKKFGFAVDKLSYKAPEEGEKLYMMSGDYMDYDFSSKKADNLYMNKGYISVVPHNIVTTDKAEVAELEKEGFNIDF